MIWGRFPPGVSIEPVYDQADLVRESLHGVRDAILLGILFSIGVGDTLEHLIVADPAQVFFVILVGIVVIFANLNVFQKS